MRTLTIAILFSIFSMALTGCIRTKDGFVSDYRSFIEEVDEDHTSFDQKDWEVKNKEMKIFLEKDFKEFEEELSNAEKTEIMADAFKYYIYQYKHEAMKEIRKMDEEQFEVMMGHMEVVMDSGLDFLDEIEPELVGIGKEFKELGDKFVKEFNERGLLEKLEKLGEKMEEMGEKMEEAGEKLSEDMEKRAEELEQRGEEL